MIRDSSKVALDSVGADFSALEISRSEKRNDYLSWDEYFMSVALLSSMRSKDPKTQVGACIINNENKIIATGYNGMPIGISDDVVPWTNHEGDPLHDKHLYVCHAELNAVLNKNIASSVGCRLYTTLFPCHECAKVIIQAGIREIIYLTDYRVGSPANLATKRMFDLVGIKLRDIGNILPNTVKMITGTSNSVLAMHKRVLL